MANGSMSTNERDRHRGSQSGKSEPAPVAVAPAEMPRVGTIGDRFQSYNIEMVEVTGGEFWKPYPEARSLRFEEAPGPAEEGGDSFAGMAQGLYAYRSPIDLTRSRLRKLAAALGPAHVRVSGTWANTTYFSDVDEAPSTVPPGFRGVLTRRQWAGVLEFAQEVHATIVTSFATCAGARDAAGVWDPVQARRLLDFTRHRGGSIAAAEFMNEPNLAAMGGAPAGYDAAAYGRDVRAFRAFVRQAAPDLPILGPGSVGETIGSWGVSLEVDGLLRTRELLAAAAGGVDAFSYHHYGAVSRRCAAIGILQTTADDALSEPWLARTDETLSFYRRLRDEFEPGAPLWLTETADAACGGNPWAATFSDTFRYLDQLGRLARQGVQVVIHNTLAASDYGLLDERTLAPRPNYWAAYLWRELMGNVVLEPGVPIREGLHVYAHSLRGVSGGVALLVINNHRSFPRSLAIPVASDRYTLASTDLQSRNVRLNGTELKPQDDGAMPRLTAVPTPAGVVTFAQETITFLALPAAGNRASG
jgi:hypothetical protein